jgi:vacuolar protein sorting-associated protein 13A/C
MCRLKIDPRGDLAAVRIASSCWSNSISLASQGTSSVIEIPDTPVEGKATRLFQLGMTISAATGKFWRTKVVTFSPRFIMINNLGETIFYMQAQTMSFIGSLEAGEHIPFHWVDAEGPNQLCIRLADV